MGLFKKKKKEIDIYKELEENVNWSELIKGKKFSEEFLDKFFDHLDPVNISMYQDLSEEFIRKHCDKLDMKCIGQYQKLSTNFIREFAWHRDFLAKALRYQDHLDVGLVREFPEVFGYQLSSDYLYDHSFTQTKYYEEWKEWIYWDQLGAKHNLPPEFIEKWIEKFRFSKKDREKLGVDEEHYNAIREGARPLSRLTQCCEIKSGTGIIINPSPIVWFEDRIPDEYASCEREEVITGRCNSQCEHCKYKEEYENSDWQLDN